MAGRRARQAQRARILASNRELLEELRALTPEIPVPEPPTQTASRGSTGVRCDVAGTVMAVADTLRPVGGPDTVTSQAAERMGLSSLPDFDDPAQTAGLVVALRGALGEQRVHALLTTGELPAPAGAATVELEPFGQPAVDLIFSDVGGRVVDAANVKIAEDADVIAEHFARWSEQARVVYASHEAAVDAARHGFPVVGEGADLPLHGPVVVDTGLSAHALEREITAGLHRTDAAFTAAELFEALPWLSYGLIATRLLRRLAQGDRQRAVLAEAGAEVAHRTIAVLTGRAVGTLATPVAGVAATIITGQLLTAAQNLRVHTRREIELIRAARRRTAAALG